MAGEIPPILVQIQADVAQLKSGLAQAEASLKGLDTSVGQTNSVFEGFGAKLKTLAATIGITFATTQVVQFFKSSVAAAIEAEQAQSRLATILRTTGAASEAQIVALNAQAQALEKVGVVTKDNITVTQSQLATFDLQGSTIEKLTPAILDYVTAEKGATASSDDFKQMTNGLAQALNGNFASLTRVGFVLDEDTKKKIKNGTEAERSAALVEVLNSTYKDFNKTLADTPEGRMIKLKNDFGNLKEEIGKGLLPTLETVMKFLSTVVIPALEKMVTFIKENSTELKVFITVLGLGATAWGVYTVAINKAKIATALFNAVMAINPIALIITAVALLVTGFVKLYNSNQKVKEAVQSFFRAVINHAARFVGAIASILEVASKIPGIGHKFKGVAEAVRGASDRMKDFAAQIGHVDRAAASGLSHLAELERLTSNKTTKTKPESNVISEDEKKRLSKIDALKDKIKSYYKSWENAQKEAQDKFGEAQESFNDRVQSAQENYKERQIEIQERFDEQMADLQERYQETIDNANAAHLKREETLRSNHVAKLLDITKRFSAQEIALRQTYEKKITDLQENAEKKRADLRKNAIDKEQSLIQQSANRLRSAFASAFGFNIKDEFEKGGGIKGILDAIKDKLTQARELQRNAAALAGKGYSQTFIEQILQAGPKLGNELSKALLEATPETTNEMQALFTELETITDTGLDVLSKTMNQGGNLATRELREAYKNVAIDLKNNLVEVDVQLRESLTEAQDVYDKAISETTKLRKEAIDEATNDLAKALAENDANLKEALAEAEKNLKNAQDKAQRALEKSLSDAQKTLQTALENAQKAFDKAIDNINDSMQKKLDGLLEKVAQAQAALAALNAAAMTPPPISYTPYSSNTGFVPTQFPFNNSTNNNSVTNNNLTINQNTLTDPNSTAMSIMAYIKYGQVVQVGTPIYTEHGTVYAE